MYLLVCVRGLKLDYATEYQNTHVSTRMRAGIETEFRAVNVNALAYLLVCVRGLKLSLQILLN